MKKLVSSMHLRGDADHGVVPRLADYDVKSDLRSKKVAMRVRPKNSGSEY